MTPPKIHGIINHSLFNSQAPPIDPIEKIRNYPTDILMVLLARTNAIIFYSEGEAIGRDEKIIKTVFDRLDPSVCERLKYLRNFPQGKQSTIFNAPIIVTLMGRLVEAYRPFSKQEIISSRTLEVIQWHLFNAILALNEWYFSRVDDTNLLTHHHLWKLELAQQNYARGVSDMYDVNAFRVYLLFRFIEEQYGEKIGKEFAGYFGVATPFNVHYAFLKTIASAYSSYSKDDLPRFWISEKGLNEMLKPFTLDPATQVVEKGDATTVMNKPFYSYREGALILDFDFFRVLAETSLIHHLYHTTSLRENPTLKTYNAYLGMLGKKFFEEYLLVQLIRKLFTHQSDKVYTDKDDPGNPDILLTQDHEDIFVIEIKSTSVHASTLVQANAAGLQEYLENNYARAKLTKREKSKGIYQLKRNLNKLSAQGNEYNVYPVIVYTEPVLDIAGVNTFLQNKMDEILAETEMPNLKIHSLTLINLNFFIKYYLQLKSDRHFLKEMIHFYHQQKTARIKNAMYHQDPWKYLHGEYSFARVMELKHPVTDRMIFFTMLADDFGFPPLPKE